MQFFYLFSFVVAASYAAALPQPAGLSEKHSNNVNVNLASGLEARSYQPAFNSQKGSATLVSLKRRDDSEGSDPSPSPTPTPGGSERELEGAFEVEIGSMNLASTINQVGDGLVDTPENVKAAGTAVGGKAGEMVVLYLKRALYVNDNLKEWVEALEAPTLDFIKAGLGDAEYSKVEPAIGKTIVKFLLGNREGLRASRSAISNIVAGSGSNTENVEKINVSFKRVFNAYKEYFEALTPLLAKFPEGKNTHGHLSAGVAGLDKFSEKQQKLHDELMQALKVATPNQ
ncbi:hypothetical protein BASA50_005756 [Batrachochytrium salamandrivorans]|uniref:Uncharacterized protein n=1 Tax=Batrachochytrium salamandrivorans TaxID=1357716 RepID=A0ABQ8FD88_9FUNG|nr:hypothetical protein BASA50_005756 [Batrachochytrium salamandrivorans]KAH9249160.1 hypothetical protein BASA81_013119 [Batrachochytrium salamandrivorans]KAH9269551.1 hypothetical protein BASA83_008371 [Batrachochytrium salamandrivorans]